MQPGETGDITMLLGQWSAGDEEAYRKLIPLLYENLRRIAGGVSGAQATQPASIVHELYLKLADSSAQSFENRVHFCGAAARAMRRILIDRVRRETAGKRGGGLQRAEWDQARAAAAMPGSEVAGKDPELGELLELRHFGGMTREEIADLKRVSAETVRLRLRLGEAWLASLLREDSGFC